MTPYRKRTVQIARERALWSVPPVSAQRACKHSSVVWCDCVGVAPDTVLEPSSLPPSLSLSPPSPHLPPGLVHSAHAPLAQEQYKAVGRDIHGKLCHMMSHDY